MKWRITAFSLIVCGLLSSFLQAQSQFEIDGQASAYGSYSPHNDLDMFLGWRYLPELNYGYTFQNASMLDFEASANVYGSVLFHPFNSYQTDGDVKPFRLWGRYTGKQFELRMGLQKIDFGTAMMLRPLQWFDEMDPRDPLKFTTGVYGGLVRYYFLNNANIWAWVLYGNENARGFEQLKSIPDKAEFGGRVQLPVPKGEIAFTYHHRKATTEGLPVIAPAVNLAENRLAIDGKWDVEVGLWFEAVHVNKSKMLGWLTNQTFVTLGIDYTFGLGKGLNASMENMIAIYDTDAFAFANTSTLSAFSIAYPLGFFDKLSGMLYCAWETKDLSFFINYEHQFKHFTAYVIGYYNPDNQAIIGSIQPENSFSGPGVRLMLVYNH